MGSRWASPNSYLTTYFHGPLPVPCVLVWVPEKWMQDKIIYVRHLLQEMPRRENGEANREADRVIRLQCKSDLKWRNEGRNIGWKHLTPQCNSEESSTRLFGISPSHLSEESGISQEWALVSLPHLVIAWKQSIGSINELSERETKEAPIYHCIKIHRNNLKYIFTLDNC